jgi:hypothetical protein
VWGSIALLLWFEACHTKSLRARSHRGKLYPPK